jgi:hypothetical protein
VIQTQKLAIVRFCANKDIFMRKTKTRKLKGTEVSLLLKQPLMEMTGLVIAMNVLLIAELAKNLNLNARVVGQSLISWAR